MLADDALREFLARTPFFGGLVDEAFDRVVELMVERRYDTGAAVFREGDQGRSMYVVRAGRVAVWKGGASGHPVKITHLGPGDFFGEMTLIAMQPRSSTVLAEEPTTLCELTNADLYKLYREDVHAYVMVLQNMNRELVRRLTSADNRITQIADELRDESTQIRPRAK